jgi:hypothetical protein
MAAHLSGDPGLLAVLSQEGVDPFRRLAAQWKGCEEGQVGYCYYLRSWNKWERWGGPCVFRGRLGLG